MSKPDLSDEEIQALIAEIRASPKYRDINLPVETLKDLIYRESYHYKKVKDVKQAVKKKLHNIVAPYLGDPDYEQASYEMEAAFREGEDSSKSFCLKMLNLHASTKERIPIMEQFYERIFSETGLPGSILDLACGLNPFALPWMGIPEKTKYYPYDLNYPRVQLINQFFGYLNRPQTAIYQDILVNPPKMAADLAFFFKEAHRFDQRQKGCNRDFWISLPVRKIVVSLPTSSLTGKHDKMEQHQRLVYEAIENLNWPVQEIILQSEIIFIIQKEA